MVFGVWQVFVKYLVCEKKKKKIQKSCISVFWIFVQNRCSLSIMQVHETHCLYSPCIFLKQQEECPVIKVEVCRILWMLRAYMVQAQVGMFMVDKYVRICQRQNLLRLLSDWSYFKAGIKSCKKYICVTFYSCSFA